ncbi:MAG: YlmC/YmxH family sporulation protein [Clostridia bacterium]|nr:YlmC/YmxH family sporulation protein [Clostridia bacterium]
MELTFSELRAKEVVNTQDGRKLGKVCDIVLCYPDNRWLGIVAPNGKAFGFKKNGLFIELKNIVKIGEDVILVNVGLPAKKGGKCPPPPPPPSHCGFNDRRSYEEYE